VGLGKTVTDSAASCHGNVPEARRILVNDPQQLVAELIDGYVSAWNRYVRLNEDGLIVRTVPKPRGRVGLAIGNGLGHEPAMMGLIGPGLFDVNIPGELFAAPGPMPIVQGIRAADHGAGVLLCVSNHSGDVLSAEMALRMLEVTDPECRILLLWDDISTSPVHGPDRRGGSGLMFVWKIVGAAAESGLSLDECVRIGTKVRDNLRSLSAVFGGTENPVTGNPVSSVMPGTALVGAGVHGDSTGEIVDAQSADSIAEHLIQQITLDLNLVAGEHCGLVVNDAGAMSVLETTLIARAAKRWLNEKHIVVDRIWCGRYATTLATAGVGLSLCRFDDELRELWDTNCGSAALCIDGPTRGF
jgi:dihydroxyacetone kinase-like protein